MLGCKETNEHKMGSRNKHVLRLICGHIRKNIIQNDHIQEQDRVTLITKKMIENHLRWFEHCQRTPVVHFLIIYICCMIVSFLRFYLLFHSVMKIVTDETWIQFGGGRK